MRDSMRISSIRVVRARSFRRNVHQQARTPARNAPKTARDAGPRAAGVSRLDATNARRASRALATSRACQARVRTALAATPDRDVALMPAHSIDGSAEPIPVFAIVFKCAGRTGECVLAMDTAAGRAIAVSFTRDLANLMGRGPYSTTERRLVEYVAPATADRATRDLAPSPESSAYRSFHGPRESADVIAAAPEGRVDWIPTSAVGRWPSPANPLKQASPRVWMWSAIRR